MIVQKAIHTFLCRRSGLAIFLLLCSVVAVSDFPRDLRAETTNVADRKSDDRGFTSSPQEQAQAHGEMLAVGDRIKIGFLETFDVPQTKTAAGLQPGMRTFYQRLDLAGEYTIQQDGTIAIPKLGVLQVAGRPLRDVQLDIAVAFERIMNRHCDVNIAILERQPIYVLGPVKTPGVYRFVPGMTVLHAIAVAGGMDRGAEQLSRVMDLLRERKQTDDLRSKFSIALAQQARLKADRDGFDKTVNLARLIEIAGRERADRLIEIVGKERAEGLFAAEDARLEQDRLTFKEESAKRTDEIARTKLELSVLEAKAAPDAHRFQARAKRLAMLQGAGSTVLASTLNAAENEKLDLEAKNQETLLSVERAKQKLLQLERSATFAVEERQARIAREIAANNEEINKLDKALRSSSEIMNLIERALDNQFGSVPRLEIIRQIMGRRSLIKADESSPLEPGDILRIKPAGPDATGADLSSLSPQAF